MFYYLRVRGGGGGGGVNQDPAKEPCGCGEECRGNRLRRAL